MLTSGQALLDLCAILQQRCHLSFPTAQVSFVTHGYAGLVHNEFDGLTFHGPDGVRISGLAAVPANISNGLTFAADFGILLGVLIAFRLATFWELLLIIKYNWL